MIRHTIFPTLLASDSLTPWKSEILNTQIQIHMAQYQSTRNTLFKYLQFVIVWSTGCMACRYVLSKHLW